MGGRWAMEWYFHNLSVTPFFLNVKLVKFKIQYFPFSLLGHFFCEAGRKRCLLVTISEHRETENRYQMMLSARLEAEVLNSIHHKRAAKYTGPP